MGREVRRVAKDWQHPKKPDGSYKPLLDGETFESTAKEWAEMVAEKGLQEAIEYFGGAPDARDYMPRWTDAEADHLMMYESTSEGTPLSPAFRTAEELARWLADHGASAFAGMTATYEEWLATINRGSAPSAVLSGGVLKSGVQSGL